MLLLSMVAANNHETGAGDVTLKTLFDRARSGDTAAEEEMFAYLRARFTFIAKRRVREGDAEDIAHEACMTVLDRYRALAPDTEFEAWAYRVLRNKIGNYLRHGAVRRRYDASPDAPDSLGKGRATDPDTVLTLVECLRRLVRTHPRYARVLNLHHHGYDSEEICRRLEISRSNLYSMLSRARALLTECIFGTGDDK
ncbi:sigma-70 family RNA polymerase sigma factor [candidate division GN15 bacterium]|nr:sigma-70 family RNA polymerase sigma factor [candidate division GN15 bacterium]